MRAIVGVVLALSIAGAAWAVAGGAGRAGAQMSGMGVAGNPTPPVRGFFAGHEVLFVHTEASDQAVAERLTRMMGPKVLVVPSLGQIPDRLLAGVYVFSNGARGEGPMGFQPDVFDSAPPDPRYTPLRRIHLVAWRAGVAPRVLRSVEEIRGAEATGEVSVTRPGIVVNMPMLTWPGGRR